MARKVDDLVGNGVHRRAQALRKKLSLLGRRLEFSLEPRVGDGDQGLGPLAQVLAEQIGHAVLGHDVVNVGP